MFAVVALALASWHLLPGAKCDDDFAVLSELVGRLASAYAGGGPEYDVHILAENDLLIGSDVRYLLVFLSAVAFSSTYYCKRCPAALSLPTSHGKSCL